MVMRRFIAAEPPTRLTRFDESPRLSERGALFIAQLIRLYHDSI
jgi:hypothetical protein